MESNVCCDEIDANHDVKNLILRIPSVTGVQDVYTYDALLALSLSTLNNLSVSYLKLPPESKLKRD